MNCIIYRICLIWIRFFSIGKKAYDNIQLLTEIPTQEIINLYILISIGAIIAFVMELSEFLVLSYTSSLTLSVSGIFKVCF